MAEGLPRGPCPAVLLKPNFKAGRQTFPFPARQGIRQGHEEACCSHPFASTPCQLWVRQISANSPNSHLEMVVGKAWGGSGEGCLSSLPRTCFSCYPPPSSPLWALSRLNCWALKRWNCNTSGHPVPCSPVLPQAQGAPGLPGARGSTSPL